MWKLGVRWWLTTIFICLCLGQQTNAQTFILNPAELRDSEGNFNVKLLLKSSEVFRVSWTQLNQAALDLSGTNSKLIIGRVSNTYDVLELDVSGNSNDFIADEVGLSPGRYYARITNSTARTATEIEEDFNENSSSVIYSNEIFLIIEANEAPSIVSPRGTIDNSSPTFQWTAVSGVPSYWIIMSSTPFDIVEDDEGNISIEGASIVWQYITKNTTANYGDINYDSPFTDEALPINSGQEYSWTVLNVYEENNPGFTSPVFGGIVPFIYNDPDAIPATTLLNPPNDETFFAEEVLTFEWDNVAVATNYTINLQQLVRQQGIDVTIPIWVSTTTNTLIEYPAIENLKNGRYTWNVISNNNSGGGTTSDSRFFNYEIPTGEFIARIRNSDNNSEILGVELKIRSVSGGVTPSLPYFVQEPSYSDSLVVGTYEFIATKDGFESATVQGTINEDRTTNININMTVLPSSISGTVVDETTNTIEDAIVSITSLGDDFEDQITTNGNGQFAASLAEGTYEISVSKSGYINSSTETITVGLNEQVSISDSFIIVNDEASISGNIFNDDGDPIQRAKVLISNENVSYEVNTNGSGAYQFTVSSGTWTISVEKTGFVKPSDETVVLSTGDVLQNQNFVLTGNANQITGFVRERVINEDGSEGTASFEGIEVRAVPSVGEVISTTSGRGGQYTLSLKSGSYTVEATEENYTSSTTQDIVIGIAVGETISGIDFELIPNPSSISGTVILPDGNGVNEATVTVDGVGTVTTSSSGFYELSVPEGEHRLTVSKNGLVSPDPRNVTVSVGQELTGVDFQMTPNAGTVSGRITSGGESLSNTLLTAINSETGSTSELTNNLNGTYSLNLRSGSWYIKATKDGFIADSTDVLSIGPGQQVVNQNLSLIENLTTVRGTITSSGDALRSADIIITKPGNTTFEQSTLSQVNGTYAVTLPAGEIYNIRVSKDGYKSKSTVTDELIAGSTSVNDFELNANPSSVSGVVTVNGAGALSDAVVIAINSNGAKVDSVTTDNDGEYLLGIDPGNYTIQVRKNGYTSSESSTILSIGQNLTGVNFTVDENFALISGVITDSDGNAIEQVFINLQKTNGRGASTVTDQNGSFSISGLTSGEFSIELSKNGFITSNETFTLVDGDFVEYDKVLTSKSGSIAGQITDENGIQLEDATVTATNTEGVEYVAITNSEGGFIINSVEPSNYEVNASKTGYTSGDATIANITIEELIATDINVINLIPNNGVIQGVITDVVSGDPIKDVQVSANGSRGSGFAITNSSGQFEITNLIPATYNLISSKDGFSSDTVSIEIDPLNPTLIMNRTLLQNNGTLNGLITDQNNSPLPFLVTVLASNAEEVFTTKTNLDGEFSFEDIETGSNYLIETDIYREGYENTSREVNVSLGVSETALNEALRVEVSRAIISGNAGINGASIKLLDATSGEIIELATSNTNSEYSFDFLPAGSYQIIPSRLGYIFNPEISDIITVSSEGSTIQNFTAQANIGTISVDISNSSSNPLSNVDVSVVSADTSIILAKKTNSDGVALFSDIKAGTDYTIRASRDGFTSNPESDTVTLSSGSTSSVTFQMLENSSSISGVVKWDDGSTVRNLADVKLSATLTSTGQNFEEITDRNGEYSFTNLASGSYLLIASRDGFTRDTISTVLNPGDEFNADDMILQSASVVLRGKVLYKNSGISGIKVDAIGVNSFERETNSNGDFAFRLPISTTTGDTTTYQIKVTNGSFSSTIVRKFASADIGKEFRLSTVNLPSGQINLLVSDGVNPLKGAKLQFGISGGKSDEIITGTSGAFESEDNLRKATYVVSVSKEGFLVPQNTVRYTLATDTTVLDTTVVIPYQQLSISEILADESTNISVVSAAGYDNSRTSGKLFYKLDSQTQFTTLIMDKSGDTLRAVIPSLNTTEPVTFYTTIVDTIAGNTFTSSQRTITPLGSGILTNVRIEPNLSGQTLRAGETYNLELLVRDGINKSLQGEFGTDSAGAVNWVNLTDTTGLTITQLSGTEIQLEILKTGNYTVKATASLNGSTVSESSSFTAQDLPIDNIIVNAPSKQLVNSSSHVFSYSAFDTSGNSVLLGQSLEWQVEPSVFGSIDNRGQFTPSSNSFLGSFTITARDRISDVSGTSDEVEMIASIRPDESYAFNNGEGFEISLPMGSVDFPSQISLTETNPPPSKKFVFAQGSDQSYTVGDRIYVLAFSGSSLKSTAQLTLPADSTISELNSGEREVARFNYTTLQWEIFESLTSKSRSNPVVGTIETERLGQFAVLAQNTPLGISNAAVLPSPFSPDIAPVKIGYWLDSAFPPAKVTIKIYNIRGELVRTLLEDDLQQPGRYGSSSSTKEITWDGLTNSGNIARNGRYIVQIKAEDAQTEEVKLLQVILIK